MELTFSCFVMSTPPLVFLLPFSSTSHSACRHRQKRSLFNRFPDRPLVSVFSSSVRPSMCARKEVFSSLCRKSARSRSLVVRAPR